MSSKHGYTRVPTVDPDTFTSSSNYGAAANPIPDPILKKKKSKTPTSPGPRNLRPGLFYQFGNRGKFAANHASVALAHRSESEHEGERIELVDMKPRRVKAKRGRLKNPRSPVTKTGGYSRSKIVLVEEPILPGDTVQRVALRYGCRYSEIRRVNNLYRDQDFFALKTVKIPIREHGVLSEENAREDCRKNRVEERGAESSGGATTSDEVRLGGSSAYYNSEEEEPSCSSRDADDESGDSDSPEYRDISIQSAIKWKHTNQTLLQKLDNDLQRVREDTEKKISNAKEVRISMHIPTFQPIIHQKSSFESRLSQYALDWRTILAVIVVLLLGTGLVVVFVWLVNLNNQHVHDIVPS